MIHRYTLPEMGAIWTEENKFRKWLEVEVAACQANAEAGNIPADAVETIRRKAHFSVERIAELERVTDHDVIAFTTNLAENIGPEARWVHYGLTSSTSSTQPTLSCSERPAIWSSNGFSR
jgi:adenylosuccinate lyase